MLISHTFDVNCDVFIANVYTQFPFPLYVFFFFFFFFLFWSVLSAAAEALIVPNQSVHNITITRVYYLMFYICVDLNM